MPRNRKRPEPVAQVCLFEQQLVGPGLADTTSDSQGQFEGIAVGQRPADTVDEDRRVFLDDPGLTQFPGQVRC